MMKLRLENAWVYIENAPQVPHVLINNLSYQDIDPKTDVTVNKCLVDKKTMRFPRGVIHIARRCLKESLIDFEEEDCIEYPVRNNPLPTSIHLRDYQEGAAAAFFEGQNPYGIRYAGIEQIGTGGGKCVCKDTINLTSKGMFYISEFDHGKVDKAEPCSIMLINRHGQLERATEFYNDGFKRVIRVESDFGFTVGGSEIEKILELRPDGSIDWIELQDVTLKTKVCIQHSQNCFGTDTHLPLTAFQSLGEKFKSYPRELNEKVGEWVGMYCTTFTSPNLYKKFTEWAGTLFNETADNIESGMAEYARVCFGIDKASGPDRRICIPEAIRRAPRPIFRGFLRGVFRNSVYAEKENVFTLLCDNTRFAKEIQVALLNFGVICSRSNASIAIEGPHVKDFKKYILSVEEPDRIQGQRFFFDAVHKMESGVEQIVDYVMPETHSFFGNGFICHNTILAAHTIAQINQPAIFFVHTKDLQIQTIRVFKEIFGPGLVGAMGGVKEEDYKNEDGTYKFIIVAMIQSLAYHGKKREYESKPEYHKMLQTRVVAFFDETHHSGSDTWFWVAQSCPAPYRMGLTATPWRADGKGILLEAATGPVIYEIPSSELIARGWLSRPDIKLYPVDTQLDHRFYQKEVDEKNNHHRRSKVGLIFNDHRNAIIIAACQEAMRNNETVLVIIKEKIHGFLIWLLLGGDKRPEEIVLVNGTFDSESRSTIMNNFRGNKSKVVIATSLYDEGVDLPSVNMVIMAAGGKSDTKVIQRLGRALRLGDRCVFLDAVKNCQLLGTPSNPFRCVELGRDLAKFDAKVAASYSMIEINEVLGNIKHWSASEYDVVGKRISMQANAKEVLRMYNTAFSEGLINGTTGVAQIDKHADTIKQLYSEVHVALENDKIGEYASLGKSTLVMRNGKSYYKKPKPSKDQQKYVQDMTKKANKLFRLCAWILGVNSSVSVRCPHKKVKTTVKYIDFLDSCDENMMSHSCDRLKVYDSEGHEPKQGDLEDFAAYDFVRNTEGMVLDYDEVMKKYGHLLVKAEEDDKFVKVDDDSDGEDGL